MVGWRSHPTRARARTSARTAGAAESNGRDAARTISAPSSRVNVAFPFSQIRLQEPSKELSELAALVFDLVEMMREWVPEDRMEELQARAEVLRDALR
jgi:hypothetical protein